ncbi:MAG: hypothetical protein WC242_02535 [Candidatus Paceibacterota bacterium]|jgi:hypothetical protein
MKQSFEVLRHGEKDETGHISEDGREKIRDRAKELFEEIKTYPEGTVIAFMPSNIERTQKTRDIFEETLISLFNEAGQGYRILDVHDIGEIQKIDSSTKEKVLIKGLSYSSLIGIPKTGDPRGAKLFEKSRQIFGNEGFAVKTWAAWSPEELAQLRQEMLKENPEAPVAEFDTTFFGSPEQVTIKQIRWLMSMMEINQGHFPNNEIKLFGISHNANTDFLVMKLLGMPINAAGLDEIGGARNYLEGHKIDIENGRVKISYRDQEREFDEEDLKKIIEELEKETEERKKRWSV